MILVIALTQFAFLTLGIALLKILVHSDTGSTMASHWVALNPWSIWLFLIPVLWTGFASACQMVNRGPLNLDVARITGVIVAVACFLFLIAVTFLPSV